MAGRQREIGIRLAMGASPLRVLFEVVRRGMMRVGLGLAAGLALAWMLSGLLAGTLYGVTPTDPLTFALVPAALGIIALVATVMPSWRATRVDPMVVLGR